MLIEPEGKIPNSKEAPSIHDAVCTHNPEMVILH
jgi:hypothetical protein